MSVTSYRKIPSTIETHLRISGDLMTISHELSSEIATALLAAKVRSPRELQELKEILLVIHSTLQRLTEDARVARLKSQLAVRKAAAGS